MCRERVRSTGMTDCEDSSGKVLLPHLVGTGGRGLFGGGPGQGGNDEMAGIIVNVCIWLLVKV